MASKIPWQKLPSGAKLPIIGLGTWKSKPGEVKQAIKNAIDVGYRHFDCAYVYQNEQEIGEAFAEKIKEGAVKREDLFVTSKLWNTFHEREKAITAFNNTLKALKLDYLDLYLIHWPMAYQASTELFPRDGNGKILYIDIDYLEPWKVLEELHKAGKIRDIGVSNFNIEQLERLKANSTVPIACNQIEVHVYLHNKELIKYCKDHNILVVAFSPLGSPDRPVAATGGLDDYPPPLQDPVVKAIAEKHKRSPGQVLLKFLVQQDLVIIPKSVNKDRLKSNLELFDFELDKDDITQLEKLDAHGARRACAMSMDEEHKYYPFGKK